MEKALLEVRSASVTFATTGHTVHALRYCSLSLRRGEVFSLVGESGAGKSTLARVIAGIVAPTTGSVEFHARDLQRIASRERRMLRRRIQMVFQDPDASLNPWHRVADIVAEPLIVRRFGNRTAIRQRVDELLALVRLDPGVRAERPRRLSGGQKQRVAIARALAMQPEVLVADEPLASLDVSTAAAIGELFRDLVQRFGITILFISHDLATVRRLAGRVAVMFAGEVVECGPCAAVLGQPAHPYTRLLIASTPDPGRRALDFRLVDAIDRLSALPDAPGACHYRSRCIRREPLCASGPSLAALAVAPDHQARCHFRDSESSQ